MLRSPSYVARFGIGFIETPSAKQPLYPVVVVEVFLVAVHVGLGLPQLVPLHVHVVADQVAGKAVLLDVH